VVWYVNVEVCADVLFGDTQTDMFGMLNGASAFSRDISEWSVGNVFL